MKKINTLLITASTVLFAQSTSAGWSVGGFVGQSRGSSLINCQPQNLPVTTLTQGFVDSEAIDAAFAEAQNTAPEGSSVVQTDNGVFIVENDNPLSFSISSFVPVIQFLDPSDFIITGQESFLGAAELEPVFLSIDVPTEFVTIDLGTISAQFDTGTPATFLADMNFTSETLVTVENPLNPSDIVSFLINTGTLLTEPFDSISESNVLFECNNDNDDIGFGFNVGYHFTKNWGIEAGYVDLGEFSSTFSTPVLNVSGFPQAIDTDASAFYLAGTGTYYYSKKWSVTARVGIYQLDVDSRVTSSFSVFNFETNTFSQETFSTSSSSKDEDLYLGTSLNYDFNDRFQIQLRYDDFDVELISLGLRYSL